MADDVVYKVTLDETEVLKSLQNIDKNIQKLANNADSGFKGMGGAAKLSGVQIGAVSGIVSSLTTEFINLGKQALNTLIDISKKSVDTALGFDTLRARLLGIFKGSEDAAGQAFDFIQNRSKALGIDLGELAGAFLPKTESLAQFERVAKIATALARSDPEQGGIGARIALIEALSGTFTSLQRRFEIPIQDIDRIKSAFDTKGIEGFISELEKVLAESGKSFEDLSDTAATSFAKVQEQGRQLLGVFGEPIVAELKQQFDDLGAVLADREPEFELIAQAFSKIVANVIDFVGSNLSSFLANLDTEQVLAIAQSFFELVDKARTLSEILGLLELPPALLDGTQTLVAGLSSALTTAIQLSVLAKAEIARRQADEAKRAEQGLTTLGGFVSFAGTPEQQAEQEAAGQAAYNKVILDSVKVLDEAQKRQADYTNSINEGRDALGRQKDEFTAAADAILQQGAAARVASEQQAELTTALDKLSELEKKASEERIDILRKAGQKTIDTEQENIDKRIDQARKFLRDIEDIEKKNSQAIADSSIDLRRDEQDAEKDYNRKLIDLEKDKAKNRIKVEEDYRDKVNEIQSQFAVDSEEAARNRDAVTFLRLQRERDKQIQEAKTTRDAKVQENAAENQDKRAQLQQELQYQLEDARIADGRRLEDLQTRLGRELEEARLKNDRELDDLATAEERKRQELATSLDRQLEEARIANQRRVDDYKASLDEEVAALVAAEEAKTQILQEQVNRRNDLQSQIDEIVSREQGQGRTSLLGGRASGGGVSAGRSYPVGERGPEIFTPSTAGYVSPLITSPLMGPNLTTTNVSNFSPSVNQSFGGQNPDAVTRMIARNEALSVINGMLGLR